MQSHQGRKYEAQKINQEEQRKILGECAMVLKVLGGRTELSLLYNRAFFVCKQHLDHGEFPHPTSLTKNCEIGMGSVE